MILASVPPVSLLLGAAAVLAYAAPALAARALGEPAARLVLLLAWVLHGAQIAGGLHGGAAPPRFGWAPALSVTVWLMVIVYLVERQHHPQSGMRWALAGLAGAAIVLALIFPGTPMPATSSPWLPLHSALGIGAYGMFAAAVVHGWLMARTERRMRQAAAAPADSVPLLTLERLMFRFIWAGFVLLTLTMVAGAVFGAQLYGNLYTGWRLDHKRVFTVLSWLVFAALLLGRSLLGWRGRRAVRVLYTGALLLLLGYVGSRFVLEVLLGRAP